MLISTRNKKLVLNLRAPGRITTVIPTARAFDYKGQTLVAVPHEVDEVRILRNLGIEAPSPIAHHYKWSGRYKPFEAQEKTSAFLTLNPKAFVLSDLGCVDAATEYLSPGGWVRMDEYTSGMVGQYDPATEEVTFVEPDEYVKLPCSDMLRIRTKYGVDQLVSREHRVLLRDRANSRKRETLVAAQLLERQNDWLAGLPHKRSSKEIGWSSCTIPTTFVGPERGGLSLTDAQLRLQIAVIADGHFPNKGSRAIVRVKKPRKITRLKRLLAEAGVDYHLHVPTTGTAVGFEVFAFPAPMRVKEFDGRFYSCSRHQLAIVRDEVMHWDGSVSDTKTGERFSTLVGASADFVQYAFASAGRVARVMGSERRGAIEYNVQVRDNGRPLQLKGTGRDGKLTTIRPEPSPDGFKYCFRVPTSYLIMRRNGCIFATGNTGKTMSALWAYDFLRSTGKANKMLIVSPLSTLERTWADEVFQHFPHLVTATLHGTADRRRKVLAGDADIYLINHDGLAVIEKELIARKDIDTVVIDEIATFRNAQTKRWKVLNKVCAGRTRVWGLTGTPTPNAPVDAWAQCRLISPQRVPAYAGKFKEATMRKISEFKWLPRDNATDIVAEAMQPSIRFSRDQCVDLPPCQYVSRHADMSPEQTQAFKEMAAKFVVEHQTGKITAANAAVKMLKLVQIGAGCAYGADQKVHLFDCKERVDVVREIIEQSASKVIVFVPFKAVIRMVADELAKDFTVACVSGDTSMKERSDIFADFQQRKDPQVLVAQPAAMSHGLTLTAASTIVWYAPITSPETFTQANGRITRPGQKHSQLIVNLSSNSLERSLFNGLLNKQNVQGILLDVIQGLTV